MPFIYTFRNQNWMKDAFQALLDLHSTYGYEKKIKFE